MAAAETQSFAVSHDGRATMFDVAVSSPSPVEGVELLTESRQLVIRYPGEGPQHFDDLQVLVEIPEGMMSWPFAASFNGMELGAREGQRGNNVIALVLNGTTLTSCRRWIRTQQWGRNQQPTRRQQTP